jgi:hypothetical protein
MPVKSALFDVQCPCCHAKLQIDPNTKAVITFEEPPRQRTVEDIEAAARALKGESARREELFQKSVEANKSSADVLSRKFDELLKKAKSDDPTKPPPKPLGLD